MRLVHSQAVGSVGLLDFIFKTNTSGIGKFFVILRRLRRNALHLGNIKSGCLQPYRKLVQGYPGLRVHLRIVNRDAYLQMIAVRAVVLLDHVKGVAVRTPYIIQPTSVIESVRLRNERVVVHPLARRVSPPSRFRRIIRRPTRPLGILGQPPPVRPDHPPLPIELVQDQHLVRCLYDLTGPEVMKENAWKPLWITSGNRIICVRGGNFCHAKRRLVRQESFPS
jgi:hypothetical protein